MYRRTSEGVSHDRFLRHDKPPFVLSICDFKLLCRASGTLLELTYSLIYERDTVNCVSNALAILSKKAKEGL